MFEEKMNHAYHSLYGLMKELQCEKVTVKYSGSSDCGCAELFAAYDHEDKEISLETLSNLSAQTLIHSQTWNGQSWEEISSYQERSFSCLAEDLAYHMLNQHGCGWEINAGSWGEIMITFDPPMVQLNHTPCEDEYEDEEDEENLNYETVDLSEEVYIFIPTLKE